MSNEFGFVRWPPDIDFVNTLLSRREDSLLDFKRDWYEDSKNGKAKLARDVLAMGNQVIQGQAGVIAIGFDETANGAQIVPLKDVPSPDSISQVLTHYTGPIPDLRIHHLSHSKGVVSLLAVFWSQYQ